MNDSAIYHPSRVSIGKVERAFCFSIVRGNQAQGHIDDCHVTRPKAVGICQEKVLRGIPMIEGAKNRA